jgi:hypothetical protein
MKTTRFKISDFINPGGDRVFRVSGTLDGKTVRRNFRSRTEAVDFRQKMSVHYLNQESSGQTVWTTLTQEQNRDAIAAVNRLKRAGSSRSLSFAVDYFLRHFDEAAVDKTVDLAVDDYLEARGQDAARGILSRRHHRAIGIELQKFRSCFAGRTVADLQASELKTYLDSAIGRSSSASTLKTWNNRRGYLSTFFEFCLRARYVAANPVAALPQFKLKHARGTAETLDAAAAAQFMHWLEGYRGRANKGGSWWGQAGCMVPYYALALFAGVRPDWTDGEMAKLRPEHIRLDTGVILIEPEVSKVNEKRAIKIQPNLRAWLEKYPVTSYPILPVRRFRDMWLDVRKEWSLAHDVMRHTFISMTVGAFRSVGDAALQAGNSEAIIRRHYLDLKSVEEADRFWRIVPQGMALPEKMEKRDGRYVEVDG